MAGEARGLYVSKKNEIEIKETGAFGAPTKKARINWWLFSVVAAAFAVLFVLSIFLVGGVHLSGDIGFDSLGSFLTEKAVTFGFGLPSSGGYLPPSDGVGTEGETELASEDETGAVDDEEESTSEENDGEAVTENEAQTLPEDTSEDVSEDISEDISEDTSEDASEDSTHPAADGDDLPEEQGMAVVGADLSQSDKGDLYIINNTSQKTDASALADKKLDTGYIPSSPYPLVLVIHTHTGESYSADGKHFVQEDGGLYSVAGVGDTFVRVLCENGVAAVHCTVIHDAMSNIDSYTRAAETIDTMLKMYPTIKYIIDIHRSSQVDADGNIIRTLCEIDGQSCSQIGMTVGMGGAWEDNLSLALKVRRYLYLEDGALSTPVTLSGSRFNAELSEYYLTVEVGSCGNTFEESELAARYLATALARVIKGN